MNLSEHEYSLKIDGRSVTLMSAQHPYMMGMEVLCIHENNKLMMSAAVCAKCGYWVLHYDMTLDCKCHMSGKPAQDAVM